MDFKITIVPEIGAPLILGDDGAGWKISVDDGMPKQERISQINPLFRAKTQKIFDRKNRVELYGFSVDRVFKSLPEALRHKHFHANAVPNFGSLIVQSRGFTATLRNCFITPECAAFNGLSVVFHYACSGEEWV